MGLASPVFLRAFTRELAYANGPLGGAQPKCAAANCHAAHRVRVSGWAEMKTRETFNSRTGNINAGSPHSSQAAEDRLRRTSEGGRERRRRA